MTNTRTSWIGNQLYNLMLRKTIHWFYPHGMSAHSPAGCGSNIWRIFRSGMRGGNTWQRNTFETNWGSWVADVQIYKCFQDSMIMSSSIDKRFKMEFVVLFVKKRRTLNNLPRYCKQNQTNSMIEWARTMKGQRDTDWYIRQVPPIQI